MMNKMSRFLRSFRIPSTEELEMAYLEGARDRYGLEYRQHEIDAGKFRRNFAYYY